MSGLGLILKCTDAFKRTVYSCTHPHSNPNDFLFAEGSIDFNWLIVFFFFSQSVNSEGVEFSSVDQWSICNVLWDWVKNRLIISHTKLLYDFKRLDGPVLWCLVLLHNNKSFSFIIRSFTFNYTFILQKVTRIFFKKSPFCVSQKKINNNVSVQGHEDEEMIRECLFWRIIPLRMCEVVCSY